MNLINFISGLYCLLVEQLCIASMFNNKHTNYTFNVYNYIEKINRDQVPAQIQPELMISESSLDKRLRQLDDLNNLLKKGAISKGEYDDLKKEIMQKTN